MPDRLGGSEMRLPDDVAEHIARKLQDMVRINGIKKIQPYHLEFACKIVNYQLMADTALLKSLMGVYNA